MACSRLIFCTVIACAFHCGIPVRTSDEDDEFANIAAADGDSDLVDSILVDAAQQVESARAGAQLLAGTDRFLATQVSASEKASVRRKHTVAALEKHGMSLEEQFQLFVLQRAAVFGLLQDGSQKSNQLPPRPASLVGKQTLIDGSIGQRNNTNVANATIDMESPGDNRTITRCIERGDTSTGVGCSESAGMKALLDKKIKAAYDNAVTQDAVVKHYLTQGNMDENNVNMAEIQKDVASFVAIDEALKTTLEGDFDAPLSAVNQEAYRRWKRRQSKKTGAWFTRTLEKLTRGHSHVKPSKMKALYEDVLALSDKLTKMDAKIQEAQKVKWNEVEERSSFVNRMWKKTKRFFAATAHNFVVAWESFKTKHDDAELKCSQSQRAEVESMAGAQGMVSGDELRNKVNRGNEDALINDQLMKTDRTLNAMSEANPGSGEALKNQTAVLKTTYQTLKTGAANGTIDMETVATAEEQMKNVSENACKDKKKEMSGIVSTISKGLKKFWKGLKALFSCKTIRTLPPPSIAVRGLGTTAGAVGGGFEEVIDFTNREIGYFAWGAAQVGTSLASAGFGGYIGFAGHGYKYGWALEESYITAVYTAYSPGVNWFGLQASVGITFCLDADNSQGNFVPWVPEPAGINGLVVGWSMGTGLSLPINFGIDVGQALYHMFTSECFSGKLRFLGGILNKLCTSCSGMEFAMISALRAGTWVAGFPIVSDAIFFVLWAINEMVRPCYPEWKQTCSAKSTNNRDNAEYMARVVAARIGESHKTLGRIRSNSQELAQMLKGALAEREYDLMHSSEVDVVTRISASECLHAPPVLALATGRMAKPLHLLPKAEIKERVAQMSNSELYAKCEEFSLSCKGRFTSWSTIRKRVRMAISQVRANNPFGKCNNDQECGHIDSNTKCERASVSSTFHVRRGDCRCKPGYCYEAKAGRKPGCYQHVDESLEEKLSQGVDIWITQREIEMGSFAEQLKDLVP